MNSDNFTVDDGETPAVPGADVDVIEEDGRDIVARLAAEAAARVDGALEKLPEKGSFLLGADEYPVEVSIPSLMRAGAHFGHQTVRWNPKMLPYIFTEKNKVHIINLDLTLEAWRRARAFIVEEVSKGANVLMVGTKQQAREIVKHEAERAGAFYVTNRWLGGTLTNFETIKRSIDKMTKLESVLQKASEENSDVRLKKKEKLWISRKLENLRTSLGGIRLMRRHPDIVFIIDVTKESIAIAESNRLHVPVIALVDTNGDPNGVHYPIPSNDDSVRTIRLFAAAVADAILEGKQMLEARLVRQKGPHGEEGENRRSRQAAQNEAKQEGAPAA